MSDISVIWDVENGRGDWSFDPLTVAGQQINVPNPTAFGTGDGVSTQFQLSPISNAINGTIAAQIFRNDWQGNQLLYATPRTNLLTQSQAFDNAAWGKAGATVTANAITAPDGTTTADSLVSGVSGGSNTDLVDHGVVSVASGTTYTYSVFLKAGTSPRSLVDFYVASPYTEVTGSVTWGATPTFFAAGAALLASSFVAVGGGWYRLSLTMSSGTGTGMVTRVYVRDQGSTNVAGENVYVWGAQLEANSTPTSYIPTTTAAVTVTDYVLSPTGLVTLASAPLLNALLSWTGSYITDTVSGGDLARGDDLETAVLVSIFTDRAANPDDVIPDGTGDPRGWWGDIGEDKPIGSRLWLLDRSKQTQEVLNNARDYINEALQWLIDDGVVASIDVQTQWVRDTFLGAWITLYQPTGTQISMTYAWAWQQLS
ncbi:phage GP46 family protein [Paraburkholderia sp. A2WS-5]|uniref:phage head spike fiber domain-containing protein n=1 Tax=Paraburkholderia sp. A2WS-5 TaxID=3028372 RepID=UPI003B7E6F12